MSTPPRPSLVFPQTGMPQGFATLATQQWDGNPEPVVREMLQNCLDACVKAGRPHCEVTFTIREVATQDLPGIREYRKHFWMAVRERERMVQGPAEKTIISRIGGVLEQDRVLLLLCRDNGVGLDADSMRGLLTEGNTDKGDAGAGAFGIGHLTAFAASDMRYVLYAGRNGCAATVAEDDSAPDSGALGGGGGRPASADIASAHAILAARSERRDDGSTRGLGAHGFWLLRAADAGAEQLGLFNETYPSAAPELLREELDLLEGSGAVVCIAGFNRFRSDDEDPVNAIARVSAKNFLVAVQGERMTVRVRDETAARPWDFVVNEAALRPLLGEGRRQKRSRVFGWLAGEQAYRCVRTLEEGETLSLACGARAKVRRLDAEEGTTSRVQLFRDGMWITNRADALTAPEFTGFHSFDAAVMVEKGEIWELVRAAEGPEHRGLNRRRLETAWDKRRLLKLLRGIRKELREWAGKVEEQAEYTPENFALFGGSGRDAEKVNPYKPRDDRLEGQEGSNATTPGRSNDGGSKRGGGGAVRPRPGNVVPGRMSIVPVPGDGDGVDTFRVYWKPAAMRPARSDLLGVRVRVPSGSDATCDLPLGPRWLRLKQVRPRDERAAPLDPDGFEAELPCREVEFTVTLAEPVADPIAVEVDIVRRRPKNGAGS